MPRPSLGDEPNASLVIPAHNEERGIKRLLDGLVAEGRSEFEIVVVCNGCTDATATVARSFGPAVRVVELPEPNKVAAMRAGDSVAVRFPRVYVDADVEISTDSLLALTNAVESPASGARAAGPARLLPREGVPWVVRAYYAVWERLPAVRTGLFGRGAIALNEAGCRRVMSLPRTTADDLAISEAFPLEERTIVDSATVTVHPPTRVSDLLRRRLRASLGNAEADRLGLRHASTPTTLGQLARVVSAEPHLVPAASVFVAVTIVSRWQARSAMRSGKATVWQRDESSRQGT